MPHSWPERRRKQMLSIMPHTNMPPQTRWLALCATVLVIEFGYFLSLVRSSNMYLIPLGSHYVSLRAVNLVPLSHIGNQLIMLKDSALVTEMLREESRSRTPSSHLGWVLSSTCSCTGGGTPSFSLSGKHVKLGCPLPLSVESRVYHWDVFSVVWDH